MLDDPFVNQLVTDLAPVRPRRNTADLRLLAAVAAIELALYALSGAVRPDIISAATLPSFWWKLGGLGALALLGSITAVRSLNPSVSPRPGLFIMAILTAATFVVGWTIDAVSGIDRSGDLAARLKWHSGIDCVFWVVALSVPMLVALSALMRRGASTDTAGSAYAAGVTGAAWGAFVFVFNCPHDDPFYILVWYLVGCGVVTALGRIFLPIITRW